MKLFFAMIRERFPVIDVFISTQETITVSHLKIKEQTLKQNDIIIPNKFRESMMKHKPIMTVNGSCLNRPIHPCFMI